ncbi:hypothetical protein NMY22_g10175 [Coprinellus aureogranulatus]|nr:hypothetical protein NMY22_g10175 [Coprinellus aureogranulatus]
MPEDPEVYSFFLQVQRLVEELTDPVTGELPYDLYLLCRCFALGTPEKPYETLSHNKAEFDQDCEPPDPEYASKRNQYDLHSAKDYGCLPLVDRQLKAGPLHVAIRGKCLVIAAGHHAVSFSLGLEACLYVLPIAMFEELLEGDAPGPNKAKAKARRMRTFKFPTQLIEETRRAANQGKAWRLRSHFDKVRPTLAANGKPNKQSINMFCAFLTKTHAVVVSDFSRLVRLHVTSLSRFWTAEDLEVGSHYWKHALFSKFPDGPDWNFEAAEARIALEEFRRAVLAKPPKPHESQTAIVEAIACNSTMAFGGFGRHLANDFLHEVLIHPLLPVYTVCSDDAMWGRIASHIAPYMAQWRSPEFVSRCCVRTNSLNPFTFNESQEYNYHTQYVKVHTKKSIRMYEAQYNQFVSLGLLDPSHTIGQPYQADPSAFIHKREYTKTTYRDVPVVMWEKTSLKLQAFSVIVAQPPELEWVESSDAWKDLRTKGNTTTIGTASFKEMVQNKPVPVARSRGRPRKPQPTGKPGRPRTSTTEKRLQVPKGLMKRPRSESPVADGSNGQCVPALSISPRRTRSAKKAKS